MVNLPVILVMRRDVQLSDPYSYCLFLIRANKFRYKIGAKLHEIFYSRGSDRETVSSATATIFSQLHSVFES